MGPDGVFLEHYAGPNLEHFVGRHLELHEDSDTAWAAAVHADDRRAYFGSDDALRRGEASQLEYRMVHPDGTTVWGDVSTNLVPDDDGNPSYWMSTIVDITARKDAELAQRRLASAVQARAVVEIGTGTGQSGLALFAGMQPDGILTSVDLEADHQRQARLTFGSVGIANQRFRLIAGDALTVLPKLSDGAYDLVLVAGDTLEYREYVEQGLRLLRHGGLLVVTHALQDGRTADPSQDDDDTLAVRAALESVSENEDLVAALLPVGDGLLAAVKR
jgi:predicted O-methyltransferase YrrM